MTGFSYRSDPNVPEFPDHNPVLVFDGDCVMCSHSAEFVLARDRARSFRFLAAQSDLGRALFEHYGLDAETFETFLVLCDGEPYLRSSAALKIASLLGFPWSMFSVFRIVPRPVRDWMYDLVARNRYRLFGKRAQCYLPSPEDAERFLR